MSIIAVVASSTILILGAVSLVREAGYEFDLRKSNRRMLGGRRVGDRG